MRTMVAQNPLHGLEYLPFEQAVRKGKDLLGGNGYLANKEYRHFTEVAVLLRKVLSVLLPGLELTQREKFLLNLQVENHHYPY